MARNSLRQALDGFRLPFEAARLLRRERRLWAPALVPLLFTLCAFAVALAGLVAYAAPLHRFVTAWIPELSASSALDWLWVGPAKLFFALLGAAAFLAMAGACLVAAQLVASLLSAPFLDTLAARVEHLTGATTEATGGTLRDALRALREELRRLLFLAALVVPLAAIGLLVPGAQLVTGPLLLAITLFFLPLDYASYCLDRRRVSFAEKRRRLLAHAPLTLGFGAAAFLACAVPGVNVLALPVLVTGGTLLALRHLSVDPHPGGRA